MASGAGWALCVPGSCVYQAVDWAGRVCGASLVMALSQLVVGGAAAAGKGRERAPIGTQHHFANSLVGLWVARHV